MIDFSFWLSIIVIHNSTAVTHVEAQLGRTSTEPKCFQSFSHEHGVTFLPRAALIAADEVGLVETIAF